MNFIMPFSCWIVPCVDVCNFVYGSSNICWLYVGGKSAVATALVVGLGGTALSTCRGNNIRSFVMTGKRYAEIRLRYGYHLSVVVLILQLLCSLKYICKPFKVEELQVIFPNVEFLPSRASFSTMFLKNCVRG